MKNKSNKVVFFGSGPVAAQSLRLLLNSFEIEAVITKPSTLHEMQSIVQDSPVLSVNNKQELDRLVQEERFSSELGILIDFGIIVSKSVIDSFKLGIINSHFSVLPEWRGADPISFAILSGQKSTGVSVMALVEAMDEGPLLCYETLALTGKENSTQLTNRLVKLSYELLKKDIPRLMSGEIKADKPQTITTRSASYSRKLTKEDGVLDFNKPARELEREVRAFIEWPKSRTQLATKDVVVLKARVDESQSGEVGTVFLTENKCIGIYTKQGALIIEELKPAGKNTMSAKAFLAGYGKNL